MSERDRDRQRPAGERETRPEDRNKSGVDKLIDKAQEKGIFDKAEKFIKGKFGGGGRRHDLHHRK